MPAAAAATAGSDEDGGAAICDPAATSRSASGSNAEPLCISGSCLSAKPAGMGTPLPRLLLLLRLRLLHGTAAVQARSLLPVPARIRR